MKLHTLLIVPLLLATISLSGCGELQEPVTEEDDVKKIKQEVKVEADIYYPDGKYYIGEVEDNVPHGVGIIYWEHHEKWYEGDWWKGKKHGIGIMYWDNGKMLYEGQWYLDKMHGNGISYEPNGKEYYRGKWVDGAPSCE